MSHYVCIVLLPNPAGAQHAQAFIRAQSREMIEAAVNEALSPFSENLEVEPYMRRCYCVTSKIREMASEAASAKHGSIEDLRASFNAKKEADPVLLEKSKEPFHPDIAEAWNIHLAAYIATENEVKAKLEENLPTADGECDECHGNGEHESTSNLNGHWDWHVIGGRWTGYFDKSYDPTKDERNIETCWLCKGTGTRSDIPAYEDGVGISEVFGGAKVVRYETGTCNNCEGKGKSVKFSLSDFDGDIIPAEKYLEMLENDANRLTPFALLTPDGKWHQKGKMLMFATVADPKGRDAWQQEVLKNVRRFAGETIAVVCDLHS